MKRVMGMGTSFSSSKASGCIAPVPMPFHISRNKTEYSSWKPVTEGEYLSKTVLVEFDKDFFHGVMYVTGHDGDGYKGVVVAGNTAQLCDVGTTRAYKNLIPIGTEVEMPYGESGRIVPFLHAKRYPLPEASPTENMQMVYSKYQQQRSRIDQLGMLKHAHIDEHEKEALDAYYEAQDRVSRACSQYHRECEAKRREHEQEKDAQAAEMSL